MVHVIGAKVDNKKNADGHVTHVWGDAEFFRLELEVEHLVSSTAAAASAEPVWRQKLVMPVLDSCASMDVRLMHRTFRGKNIEWVVVGTRLRSFHTTVGLEYSCLRGT